MTAPADKALIDRAVEAATLAAYTSDGWTPASAWPHETEEARENARRGMRAALVEFCFQMQDFPMSWRKAAALLDPEAK